MENGETEQVVTAKRKITNEDIIQYEPMVEKFIRDNCMKNWNESRKSSPDSFLGTSGYSLNDLKQHLRAEICVALQNYNPNYRTKDGKSVKESTFVYQHLTFRVGQKMKQLTKKRCGYGVRHNPVHLVIEAGVDEADCVDVDLALAYDTNVEKNSKGKSQVERFLEAKSSGRSFYDA